jgi:hypothetical protein
LASASHGTKPSSETELSAQSFSLDRRQVPGTDNHAHRRRRRRPGRQLALLAAAVIVLLAVSLVGALGYQQATQLQTGLTAQLQSAAAELRAGKTSLKEATAKSDPQKLAEAEAHFQKAEYWFAQARTTTDGSTSVFLATLVPVVGQSYVAPRRNALQAITTMGLALADAGEQAVIIDRSLIAPSDLSAGGSGPSRMLAIMKAASGELGQIEKDLKTAQAADQSIDMAVVPAGQQSALTTARDSIKKGLDAITEFRNAIPMLLEILGDNGPRTYIVQQVDPADLRGGGGFIGSYSLVVADKGDIKMQITADTATIDYPYPKPGMKTYIQPPNPLYQFAPHGWIFGDSNYNPNFPASAIDAETTFANETGVNVDGVISIDPWAIALLLQATGPLPVPGYTTVDANTFPEVVFQRLQAHPYDPQFVKTRKLFLTAVAKALISRLSSLPTEQWSKVVSALNTAVSQRHLQAYFNRSVAQQGMTDFGWDGRLVGTSQVGDFLMENESNFGATKANHFLQRHFDLKLTNQGGLLRHTLTVTLKNSTPSGYINGRRYIFYVRIYVPADSTNLSRAGNLVVDRYPSQETQAGLVLMDGWGSVNVDPKLGYGVVRFTFAWSTSISSGGPSPIYWQKQPGTLSDSATVSYTVNGHTVVAHTDLGQDRIVTLKSTGIDIRAGSSGTAVIPSLGF